MGRVILVSAFSNINSLSNSRTYAIYQQIESEKTVLTTDFNHSKKQYFKDSEMGITGQVNLHVLAYKKNLSLRRILSHIVFARGVNKYLNSLTESPSAIYCAMPTSSAAYVCAKYCKRHGVKFIIDVIDLWPDSLLPLVIGNKIIKACLSPWTYLTHFAYRNADVIMGESEAYANEAMRFNKEADVYPLYLGVDLAFIERVKNNNPVELCKPADEIWVCYAGSLGESYGFDALLDAVRIIHKKYKYKLWFIGDGVKRAEIENYLNENGLNAEITGFLPYEHLLGYLSYCDISINIFRENTKVVYSYKFNDYVAMNCFVLNSLKGETSEMVDKYQIGRNFNYSDQPLSAVLDDTMAHWEEYSSWRGNHQRLIDEKLDKEKIYSVVKEVFQV